MANVIKLSYQCLICSQFTHVDLHIPFAIKITIQCTPTERGNQHTELSDKPHG